MSVVASMEVHASEASRIIQHLRGFHTRPADASATLGVLVQSAGPPRQIESSEEESSSMPMPVLVGGAAGGAVIGLLCLACCCCSKPRKFCALLVTHPNPSMGPLYMPEAMRRE